MPPLVSLPNESVSESTSEEWLRESFRQWQLCNSTSPAWLLFREQLVLLHAPLVEHCARSFLRSREPLEDLIQEGYVGLMRAIDRFDPDKGVRFSTYAYHFIAGEIRHYLRDSSQFIHEPGWHSALRQRVARANEQLSQQLGRSPHPIEIAALLQLQVEVVSGVLQKQQALIVESLEEKFEGSADAASGDWRDILRHITLPLAEQVENHLTLQAALLQLREVEREAVTLFFFGELSKTEIAQQLGISINYAAYLIKRGLKKLQQSLN